MAKFVWKGKTRTGQVQRGVIAAKSREEAEVLLRQRQITPTQVREEGKEFKLPVLVVGSKKRTLLYLQDSFQS